MIKAITLTNFKGHNRSFQLGAATMILGDNFRGKTGVFQGIAMGVHGWLKHPTADKKLDPYGLASGNPMSTQLDLDSGPAILRRWTKDKKGSVRYDGYEGEPLAPPILLDARHYLDLSADKRMRYVFGAVKLADGAFSSSELIAKLKNLKVDPMTTTHQEALTAVVSQVSESWESFTSEKEMGADITIQDWLSTLIESLKEKAKLAKQAVDRMAKTVSGITELQVRDTTEIDANTAAAEAQMQTLREQIAQKQKELGAIDAMIAETAKRNAALAKLRTERATLPTPDDKVLDEEALINAEMPRLQAEIQTLSTDIGRLQAELKQDKANIDANVKVEKQREDIALKLKSIPDQTDEITRIQGLLETDRAAAARLADIIALNTPVRSNLGTEIAILKTSKLNRALSDLKAERAKLAELDTLTECPFCSCSGDTFRTAARAHFETRIDDLEASVVAIDAEVTAKGPKWDAANAAITSANKEHEVVLARIKAMERTLTDCKTAQTERRHLTEDLEHLQLAPVSTIDWEQSLAMNVRKLESTHARVTTFNGVLTTIASMKRAQSIDAQLAAGADVAPSQSPDALRAVIDSLNSDFNRLDAEVKRGVAAKADALRQNQAVAERDKAKAEQEMTKLAVEAVTEFQQSMVDQAFATIIKDANRFTDGILDSPLVYQDGEIGRMQGGIFVGHEYLSGTEQALCFAGISVALAMQATFKLCMIDEMTRLSARNKALVLERMLLLLDSGVIENFIGVDTDIAPYQPLKANHSDALQFIKL